MTQRAADDFAAIRARQAEIAAERAKAAGMAPPVAAIAADLAPSIRPFGEIHPGRDEVNWLDITQQRLREVLLRDALSLRIDSDPSKQRVGYQLPADMTAAELEELRVVLALDLGISPAPTSASALHMARAALRKWLLQQHGIRIDRRRR